MRGSVEVNFQFPLLWARIAAISPHPPIGFQ
jgi:hypothetical protein